MQQRDREDTILRMLALRNFVNLHDLVEATGSSEATLRRDFIRMEKKGQLLRMRGGVEPAEASCRENENGFEPPFYHRKNINREQKRKIARLACSLLRENEIIMIDGGTTCYYMIEYLPPIKLNIVTNSLAIAEYLSKYPRYTVSLPEGNVDQPSMLILNSLITDPFVNYNASKVFMGIEGITEESLTNSEPRFIQTKLGMIRHSRELIILADETKFGKAGLLNLCEVEKVSTIITTDQADRELLGKLKKKGIRILQAD